MRQAIIAGALLAACLLGALIQAARQERGLQRRLDSLSGEVSELARLVRQAPATPPAASPAGPLRMDDLQLDILAGRVAARMATRQGEAAAGKARQPATGDAEAPPEPTPAQREAAERARQIVDQAISRHALSLEDVTSLRQLATKLDPSAQEAMRLRIATAINRQELKPDPRVGLP
jgi:hypothetical protein